jgi:hypothetical protein
MLANPRLVEAERVEVFDEFKISLQGKRRVGARAMERCDEIPKSELGHVNSLAVALRRTLNPPGNPRPAVRARNA